MAFVTRLIELRRAHPVFRRQHFFQDLSISGAGAKDIHWFKPDGLAMSDEEWAHDFAHCLGVYLSGESMQERDTKGQIVNDDNFLLLFNAHHEGIDFHLPMCNANGQWLTLLDTHIEDGLKSAGCYCSGDTYPLEGRTFVLLMQKNHSQRP